jgi:vacuolar-type H+-ATPase subunit F/Vma7
MPAGLCAFIGDELSAAGFRLAGVDVHVLPPAPTRAAALLRRLIRDFPLLLVTAQAAASLPRDELDRVLASERPLVLVIADARGRLQPPDVSALLRRQLGMAE